MSAHSDREEKILAFWKERGIFEKSLAKDASKGDFTFYDGPPFATGTPHYGHILAGTMKDVIPRWKTMQGYRVRRRWGWDCHGLPVENLVEKELGLKTKKDIITYGIGKFNAAARESVMRYADEWRRIIPRMGRWVDMENDYRTMDATYTESVWWIFKTLHEKGLIYEGFKSMNLCPRCETTLSNFEVAQGYKDITDISATAEFKVNDNTFFLAWTTTPWTLPGNVALAVNPNVEYVKVKSGSNFFIVAEARLTSVFKDPAYPYEVVEKMKGSTLVGLSYEPIFNYYANDKSLKDRENAWKVYAADFVTTEDGTGIVHIAPAFGADDYEMLKKYDLPFIQHVAVDGTFKKEVTDFVGMHVKPKSTDEDKFAHQKADIEIIKYLAHHDTLFEKEKFIHSYPHCWRCETPLLNYATSSWFVKVTDLKDKLVKENQKIAWIPPEVGEGRFGNWLAGARDWAISRTRFWGAPIPVWRIENTAQNKGLVVIGSVADLKKYSHAKNTYYIIRHGEAENNVRGVVSNQATDPYHLTEKGKAQVTEGTKSLKDKKIDLIFISPFVRAQETAAIVAKELGLDQSAVKTDVRLGEWSTGAKEQGQKIKDLLGQFPPTVARFTVNYQGGENYAALKKRMGGLLYDIESKYEGKNILFVTHESPALMLYSSAQGLDRKQIIELQNSHDFLGNGQVLGLDFTPLPHNAEYELDLHRPFIDDFELRTADGSKLTRVPDVFDCWFESGAMPFGENHYPFKKAQGEGRNAQDFEPRSGLFKKSRGYPADFIAEGLDQTRGWFYSMLVLGVALFGKTPYKKVLVNGLVLAEDGEKMSKRKNNYPDPMLIVDKYGADSLRYYLMSSPVVRAQDLRFSEKGVDEITKKLVNRLLNVVSFYEMYVEKGASKKAQGERGARGKAQGASSNNVLDRWIMARLNETAHAVTTGLEAGELDRAARPFMDLVDDMSTWYLRRSRDRFKGEDMADKQDALATTKYVLVETTKLLAPFMPFLAEDIYRRVNSEGESVHLENWPTLAKIDVNISESMEQVQRIASQGLDARTTAKINVRQPLQSLKVKGPAFKSQSPQELNDFVALIKDEVNIKEVIFNSAIENEVELNTILTPALREEGTLRELARLIQDLRKEKGLNIGDRATLLVDTDEVGRKFIEKNKTTISKTTSLKDIEFGVLAGEFTKAGEISVRFVLK